MSATDSDFTVYLLRLASSAPVYIVWLIGIVLALMRWRKHPQVSLMIVLALGMMLVTSIIFQYLYIWLPRRLLDGDLSSMSITRVYTVLGVIHSSVSAVGFGLLLVALFRWRHPPLVFEKPDLRSSGADLRNDRSSTAFREGKS
jgi:hypothetical protein